MAVQTSYAINPDVGFPGQIAEPNSPHRLERGVLNIETGASRAKPRPGDGLYYDTTNNAWQVAEDASERRSIQGILSYRADTVANAASIVEFADGAEIEVITLGVVWLTAGAAVERGQNLVFQADFKWDPLARVTTVATMHIVPVTAYNVNAATDGDVIKAAIGYGRAL